MDYSKSKIKKCSRNKIVKLARRAVQKPLVTWWQYSCQIKSFNHKLIILETDRFYVALEKVGTNFDAMEKMFENHEPTRDRKAQKYSIKNSKRRRNLIWIR